jgi:hypothetical protein
VSQRVQPTATEKDLSPFFVPAGQTVSTDLDVTRMWDLIRYRLLIANAGQRKRRGRTSKESRPGVLAHYSAGRVRSDGFVRWKLRLLFLWFARKIEPRRWRKRNLQKKLLFLSVWRWLEDT